MIILDYEVAKKYYEASEEIYSKSHNNNSNNINDNIHEVEENNENSLHFDSSLQAAKNSLLTNLHVSYAELECTDDTFKILVDGKIYGPF